MRPGKLILSAVLIISFQSSPVDIYAQVLSSEIEALARKTAMAYVNDLLPAHAELYYLQNENDGEQSFALRYDWHSNKNWVDDFGAKGTDFSGTGYSFFARGNYVFNDEAVNPSELSEIGAKWSRRWFPITVLNPLNAQQSARVQQCITDTPDFNITVEDCRRRLGFGETRMKYWYLDIDAHINVEGDQSFNQRHYVYGLEANFSRSFGTQTVFLHPILTLGVDQVDPKGDRARLSVAPEEEIYSRFYGNVRFTGNLFQIDGQRIKLSFSVRYFQEFDPEPTIKAAGLDTFCYTAVAVQVPAAIFPGFDNTRNSFVLSYASGELPFNLSSEKTFELGFRHDIDFLEFF